MANIKLGGTTALSESGGTVVLDSAVQDNITRLGTVASGVIGSAVTGTIGTGVTFPAHHVIQVIWDQSSTSAGQSSASFGDAAGLGPEITIKQANSNILITCFSSSTWGGDANGSSIPELIVNLKRVITDGATTNEIVPGGSWNAWMHSRNHWGSIGGQYMDSPAQPAGTVITYSIRIRSATGSNVDWIHAGGMATMSLMEIAT